MKQLFALTERIELPINGFGDHCNAFEEHKQTTCQSQYVQLI